MVTDLAFSDWLARQHSWSLHDAYPHVNRKFAQISPATRAPWSPDSLRNPQLHHPRADPHN
jgi:hypothetical protein